MKLKFKFYALKLCIVMFLIFVLQVFIAPLTDLFVLNENALNGEYWRFITAIFVHGGIGHFLYNVFALALFGSILEGLSGSRRFLSVFFITGILANLVSIMFYNSSLGASGAIFGVIGALILIRPFLVIWAFGLPMPIFVAGILWAFGDLIGAIGFLAGNPIDNTGNIAHLFGMFFGLVLGYFLKEKKSKGNKKESVRLNEGFVRKWEDYYMKEF